MLQNYVDYVVDRVSVIQLLGDLEIVDAGVVDGYIAIVIILYLSI